MKFRNKRKHDTIEQDAKPAPGELTSPLSPQLFKPETVSRLRKNHEESQPYKHVVIDQLCIPERMCAIQKEATENFTATFKETDLFKVYQTGDLGAFDANDKDILSAIPNIAALRKALYSKEFREFVTQVTGCGELTDRTDVSTNAYAHSCHLLCHDDVIGTRRISWIIYFSDPDYDWQEKDGGGLELYPLDPSSIVDRGAENGGVQGVPVCVPTKTIAPKFNSIAFFVVQPGRSYHSVQEVFTTARPRLSISGWYHGVNPPVGSDKASLQQIMSKGDDFLTFTSLPKVVAERKALSAADADYLSQYMNSTYLTAESIGQIKKTFCKDSSIQLKNFIRPELAAYVTAIITAIDREDGLGFGKIKVPVDYTIGTAIHKGTLYEENWELIGPTHKRRYLQFRGCPNLSDIIRDYVSVKDVEKHNNPGLILDIIRKNLFRSPVFQRYLKLITCCSTTSVRDEIRRFRPARDYTVAYFGSMTNVPKLDCTLCFVNEKDTHRPKVVLEEGDDEPLTAMETWESGDVGGFECYIEADTKTSAEAAEVYKTAPEKENDEDEDTLLSVNAGNNVLSIVMRDDGLMRFVKYVTAGAPSSRWDISVEYEMEVESDSEVDDNYSDSDEEEEDGEEE